ncbi:hypothetical protein AB0C89_28050 [Streptomyces sp. NPDC048491]|uniref:hypothetical protein n=1 Tax=Streptomyces TaxID=1883 RepID=UPI000C27368B|nr:hypothetical protein [Streptomyces sp. CB01201]PJN01367.1 hypothetical protein CG740_19435 [Streptomyces sp. CB01201]
MDIVYLSLDHRPGTIPDSLTEAAEALDTLWAHTTPEDGLEHASARTGLRRLDLLLFLLPPDGPGAQSATGRGAALVARSYRNSPLLKLRYLPPAPAPSSPGR